jgi:hypothetical protein
MSKADGLTVIKGQPTSAKIRADLAAKGAPVLVAFSTGKDALAVALALQDSGVRTELAYLYLCPGKTPGSTLGFIEDTLKYQEDKLGQKIHRYPHPSLWRWINNLVCQSPDRIPIIAGAEYPAYTYADLWANIREDLGMPADALVADGVRAADSIVRRASLTRHGVLKPAGMKVSPIADWLKATVMDRIQDAGIDLPVDYEWFGRSFDGMDARFTVPLKTHAPADYDQFCHWFPMVPLWEIKEGLMRQGVK